jgi:hypothetical protein
VSSWQAAKAHDGPVFDLTDAATHQPLAATPASDPPNDDPHERKDHDCDNQQDSAAE